MTMFNILPTEMNFSSGGTGPHDLFRDFLETDPNLAFQGALPQGQSPGRSRFFQNSFEQIHNQFLGTLGRQLQGGQMPTGRFTDFLQGMDWNQFAAAASPFQRGEQTQRFAPSTRSLFF